MKISSSQILKTRAQLLANAIRSQFIWLIIAVVFLTPIIYSFINQPSKLQELEYAVVISGGIDTSTNMALSPTVLKFELKNKKENIVWAPSGTPILKGRKIELEVYKRIISGAVEYEFVRYFN